VLAAWWKMEGLIDGLNLIQLLLGTRFLAGYPPVIHQLKEQNIYIQLL